MPIQDGHNLFNTQQEGDFGPGLSGTTHINLGEQPVTTIDNIKGGWISIPSSENTHSFQFNQLDTGQIIYTRNDEKLYYVEIFKMGVNGYFVPNGIPGEDTGKYFPNSASFIEMTFPGGDPTGISDPLNINSLTVNDGGTGTKFELLDNSTLTLTAQSTNDILLIKSGSNNLGLRVNGDGLIQLDEFNYTPPSVEGGLLYSGSNFYLGIPTSDNVITGFEDINLPFFEDNSNSFNQSYVVSTVKEIDSQLTSNAFSVFEGEKFQFEFFINYAPEGLTLNAHEFNNILTNNQQYLIRGGSNKIPIKSNFKGNMQLTFNFTKTKNNLFPIQQILLRRLDR